MIALSILFFIMVIGLAGLTFWIYALIEIVGSHYKSDTDKIVWFLLVFFLPFLGTILYFFMGRNKVSASFEEEYV